MAKFDEALYNKHKESVVNAWMTVPSKLIHSALSDGRPNLTGINEAWCKQLHNTCS